MRLEVSREALVAIRTEAAASPEVEVCGLLLGDGLRVEEVRSCRNVANDPATTFEIDPQALIAAYKSARDGGPAVIGHYHSHPGGRAEPSARDSAAARGGEVWVIAGSGDVSAWLAGENGRFDPLPIRHPGLVPGSALASRGVARGGADAGTGPA